MQLVAKIRRGVKDLHSGNVFVHPSIAFNLYTVLKVIQNLYVKKLLNVEISGQANEKYIIG